MYINPILQEHSISHLEALRRSYLTPVEAHLQFSTENINRPIDWWRHVCFSDEATVQYGQGGRQKRVCCKKVLVTPHHTGYFANIKLEDEKLLEQHVQPRIKPTRHAQMFWPSFSYHNRTSLVPLLGDPGSIFQEHNASTHTAKLGKGLA